MIERSDLLALGFYKKEAFTGSFQGMRYRIAKADDSLSVTIWPEPFCFEKTPDSEKQTEIFPFSEEGLCQVTEYLNTQHDAQLPRWKNAPFWVIREEKKPEEAEGSEIAEETGE